MQIRTLSALSDNFIYLLSDAGSTAVVDPAEAGPVAAVLERENLSLSVIILTHGHADHTGGCRDLVERYSCEVIGADDPAVPAVSRSVRDGETFHAVGSEFLTLAVPGHTPTHLAFYSKAAGCVFTGDCLFVAGCGRLLGCTPDTFWASLQRLRALAGDTRVYCGHEYTVENLEFALSLQPRQDAVLRKLAKVRAGLRQGKPSVPSTVGEERLVNPFLRADDPLLKRGLGMEQAADVEVFAELRRRKDRW